MYNPANRDIEIQHTHNLKLQNSIIATMAIIMVVMKTYLSNCIEIIHSQLVMYKVSSWIISKKKVDQQRNHG